MKKDFRSKAVWWIAGASNWVSDAFAPKNLRGPIEWRDRVRWFIEGILERLFVLSYIGSQEEIRDGVDFALDDVPNEYLTPMQREIKARLAEWVDAQPEEEA